MSTPVLLELADQVSSIMLSIFLRMIGKIPAQAENYQVPDNAWSEDLDADLIRAAAVLADAWSHPGELLSPACPKTPELNRPQWW